MAESARLVRSDGNIAAGVLGAAVVVGLGVAAVAYGAIDRRLAIRHRCQARRAGRLPPRAPERLRRRDPGRRTPAPHSRRQPGRPPVRLAVRRVPRRARRDPAAPRAGRGVAAVGQASRWRRQTARLSCPPPTASRATCRSSGRSRAGDRRPGKRCLWRALQSLLGGQPIPSARSLGGLEAMAVRQWDAIEDRRRALVGATFPSLQLSPMDVPID